MEKIRSGPYSMMEIPGADDGDEADLPHKQTTQKRQKWTLDIDKID